MSEPEYPIGYGRPPRHTQFRKGESGNPKGRPKSVENFAKLAQQAFNEKIVIKENGRQDHQDGSPAQIAGQQGGDGGPRASLEALKLQSFLAQSEETHAEPIIVRVALLGAG